MIVVELLVPEEGSLGYRVAGALRVVAGGGWELDGEQILAPDLRVMVPGEGDEPGRFVTFDEDPMAWARGLPSALRTGYLVAKVFELDDEPNSETRQS